MDLTRRAAGVLLHLSSLPGPHGIGDFGPGAYHFVDWLAGAGQRLWQWLPTTPIGPGNSPYQSVSAFAGSPLMVALEPLVEAGWLALPALPAGGFDSARVDFDRVVPWRMAQLRSAYVGYLDRGTATDYAACEAHAAAEAGWLDDYALFMALETAHDGRPWWQWPAALAAREQGVDGGVHGVCPSVLSGPCKARTSTHTVGSSSSSRPPIRGPAPASGPAATHSRALSRRSDQAPGGSCSSATSPACQTTSRVSCGG